MQQPVPLEEALGLASAQRSTSLGLPSGFKVPVALTPQGAGMLVNAGIKVRMESHAGDSIHYPDARYASQGVEIVTRREALACDIVLAPKAITRHDALALNRGATLLILRKPYIAGIREGLERPDADGPLTAQVLLSRCITCLWLGLVTDAQGRYPIADTLADVAGRAAVIRAVSRLSGAGSKFLLPGGVSGVAPCEAMVLGAGVAGRAAACTAAGLGMIVRVFDNDLYRLRAVADGCHTPVIATAMHPTAIASALRTADIVVVTSQAAGLNIGADAVASMKADAVIMSTISDINVFTSLPQTYDLLEKPEEGRFVILQPQMSVYRTMAMALTNALVPLCQEIVNAGGGANAIKLNPGLARGVVAFRGHPTHPTIAALTGDRVLSTEFLLKF